MTKFAPDAFDRFPDVDGEYVQIERDGLTIRATIHHDDDAAPPWEETDGHGPVSDWTDGTPPGPGWAEIDNDHGGRLVRFYDMNGALEKANKEGWGVDGGMTEGESLTDYRMRAVQLDFERMRGWCRQDWRYIGIAVTVWKAGIQLTADFAHALWTIESDSGSYLAEVANEYADEAIADAREVLKKLCK